MGAAQVGAQPKTKNKEGKPEEKEQERSVGHGNSVPYERSSDQRGGPRRAPRCAAFGRSAAHPFDLPPGAAFVAGDVNDPSALLKATRGHDAVVYLAMGSTSAGESRDEAIGNSFDVNVKGVWRACDAARLAGASRFV